jgi:hypothetical protein
MRVALRRMDGREVGRRARLARKSRLNGGDICGMGGEGNGGRGGDGEVAGARTNMTVGGFEDGVCCLVGGTTKLERLELGERVSVTVQRVGHKESESEQDLPSFVQRCRCP